MNLFYLPSLTSLATLIASNANYYDTYYIIVKEQGEVMMESESCSSVTSFHSSRFYFNNLQGKTYIGIRASRDIKYLNQLYKNLFYCWDNNLRGVLNYTEISNLQIMSSWLEQNKIFTLPESKHVPSSYTQRSF
ncbi:MAG: hypothetical protein ABI772_06280 [Bacteroidota bacterium]